jgi:HD-GYP domain-containing protein (c-di-GMP phosphodiesterase class II)
MSRKTDGIYLKKEQKDEFVLHRRLGLKLILQFMLFGLLLGFFVYFLAVILDSGDIIKDVVILVSDELNHDKKISAEKKSSIHRDNVNTLINDLEKKYSSVKNVIFIRFFNQGNDSKWREIRFEDKNHVYVAVDNGTSDILFTALKRHFTKASKNHVVGSVFDGYIRLDDGVSSDTANIMYLRVDKTVFVGKIISDRDLLIGYAVLLLIFSIVIGKFFAAKIIHPVNELIRAARKISKGDYGYRNRISCNDEIGYLGHTLNLMAERVDSHIREIEYRSKAMGAMNEIDKTVLKKLFDPNVIDIVAGIVASFLGKGMVLLAVPLETGDIRISHYGESGTDGIMVLKDIISASELKPENDFRRRDFIQIVLSVDSQGLPLWISGILSMDHGTIVHAPLYSSETYQGSCFIVDCGKSGFSDDELEAVRMLADQVGVALQNSSIYIEKENLFIELLYALTRAIDAKSKWTSGHSERVAGLSMVLGNAMNLPEKELETLKISAMLHDIGKIATPEYILDKPGKLTDAEYDEIKKHPVEGSGIIGGIKSYEKIVPGILYHHEHWDGSGYPEGMKGEDIPLISRIIAIADVYDAILADRPYRKGMEKEEVSRFMYENSGRLFDPDLLILFMKSVE